MSALHIIQPIAITNDNLTSSSVAENDYPEWNVGTTYAEDDYVIVIGTAHSVYQSVQGGNTGKDPITDDGTWWTRIGATNRWKAFDQRTNDLVSAISPITYSITPTGRITSVALFNIDGATEATITLTDESTSPETEVYNRTISLLDESAVVDAFTYCFEEIQFVTEIALYDLPPYGGARLDISIEGETGATIGVGQIVAGQLFTFGEVLTDTEVGIIDRSVVRQDVFGYTEFTKRSSSQTVDFIVAVDTVDSRRIQKKLANLLSTAAVFSNGPDTDHFGTTIFGFFTDFHEPLKTNKSLLSLAIEGF